MNYTIAKVHSTKWAVKDNAGQVVDTAKTKGAAQVIADNLTAKAKAVKVANKKNREVKTAELTRKQCVARLKELGYTGPTSYLMPKLRKIVAEVEANASVAA